MQSGGISIVKPGYSITLSISTSGAAESMVSPASLPSPSSTDKTKTEIWHGVKNYISKATE